MANAHPMRIILITPAPATSLAGNRTTAARWAQILRTLGHRVEVATRYQGQRADLMIALHAWRSAEAVVAYRDRYPDRPLIVGIAGTDAYRFLESDPRVTLRSIELADRLVGLHDLIGQRLPPRYQDKMQIIYQSAKPVNGRDPYRRYFHIAVMGHLREEKDPLRPALAVRNLPSSSRIQVHHYGKAHTPDWADRARVEMASNPRYHWHDEVSHAEIRRIYRRTQLLLLPSLMEGGANVISEAVMAKIPVVASSIEGSIGLLGPEYPGYFPVGDEVALFELLMRVECEPAFYQTLEQACLALRPRFSEAAESQAWQRLLSQF
ncbi:TIGR04348 family glycosyltransferase [Aestuariirhabdus sp. Z084]|uniref:selenoneine biosynthesis selenosugar synthase SenB n=1 Tax=Aestuariirhabdus haliotis TaxID=2918751 RepID=UPI00201B42B4|nr:selenoneine biosynthesis selenosugar synthase SenB [Aestuariirhabdus haliotis]MCL6414025.1 TIGR04348 family glycosyltransferase [Aestuariirhabdus haliotis]MCL6417958.1 TIGR04348 family glycosyltransferase [Aestuariirhabdus haliotis]